jgi:hypothetical protein
MFRCQNVPCQDIYDSPHSKMDSIELGFKSDQKSRGTIFGYLPPSLSSCYPNFMRRITLLSITFLVVVAVVEPGTLSALAAHARSTRDLHRMCSALQNKRDGLVDCFLFPGKSHVGLRREMVLFLFPDSKCTYLLRSPNRSSIVHPFLP